MLPANLKHVNSQALVPVSNQLYQLYFLSSLYNYFHCINIWQKTVKTLKLTHIFNVISNMNLIKPLGNSKTQVYTQICQELDKIDQINESKLSKKQSVIQIYYKIMYLSSFNNFWSSSSLSSEVFSNPAKIYIEFQILLSQSIWWMLNKISDCQTSVKN